MSLTTTMGVEFTWVPQVLQIAQDRGVEWDVEDIPGESSFVHAYAQLMRRLIKLKRIPVHQCDTDPGCVEVSTRPYTKLDQLLSVYRRLNREAMALGLIPSAEYTGGGGAHIHTGIPFSTRTDRQKHGEYVNHFMLWAAQNPWVSWAFLNVVDDVNAEPFTVENLLDTFSYERELKSLTYELQDVTEQLISLTAQYHSTAFRTTRNPLTGWRESRIKEVRFERMSLLKRIKALGNSPKNTRRSLSSVNSSNRKNKMVRVAPYGKNGTIEFRCFEMGDEAKIKRQIIFANAVCSYVEKMDCTEFDTITCFTQSQLNSMKWSDRRNGFLAMLDSLGLDRTEYRRERVQIALRMRYQRAERAERKAEAAPESDVVSRCRSRHDRRLTRNGRYQPAPASTGGTVAMDDALAAIDDDFALAA